MASGFFALLDDIAVLARATAGSLDDVVAGAAKASSKTSAVVIDDMAVSPQYVKGLDPKRELPIVARITIGSLRNKFLFILPAVLILSWLAPWLLPFLLIIGGSYLVYEGAEKVLGWVGFHAHGEEHLEAVAGSAAGERKMVAGAVRTDLVLSTEIMLIALSSLEVADDNWISKAVALSFIALIMTAIVYGAVALLVKLDDIGAHIATKPSAGAQAFGKGLVRAMPKVFTLLSVVGTVAMLWVGGHLLWKSLGDIGWSFAHDTLHGLEEGLHPFGGFLTWTGDTLASTLIGLVAGLLLVGASLLLKRLFKRGASAH